MAAGDSSQHALGVANLLAQQSAGKVGDSSKEDFEGMVGKSANTIGKMLGVNAESLLATGLFKSFESAGLAASMINKAAGSFSSSGGFLAKLFDAIKSEGMKIMDWTAGVGGGAAIESTFREVSFAELGGLSPQSFAGGGIDMGRSSGVEMA